MSGDFLLAKSHLFEGCSFCPETQNPPFIAEGQALGHTKDREGGVSSSGSSSRRRGYGRSCRW